MAEVVLPLPRVGEIFLDARGADRTMRGSHHPERGMVVISLWSGPTCRASFRLSAGDAARLHRLRGSVEVVVDTGVVPDGDLSTCATPTGGGSLDTDLPRAS